MVAARLDEFRRDRIFFLQHRVTFRREGRKVLLPRFFKRRQFDGDALHFRLRLVPFARDVVELVAQRRQIVLHLADLLREPLRGGPVIRDARDYLLALGLYARDPRLSLTLRLRGGLRARANGDQLPTELFEFRVEQRIGQHSLTSLHELRVLLLQFLQRALRLRELPRDLIAGLHRGSVLGLDPRRDLLTSRDLGVETGVQCIQLPARAVALDDQRLELLLERRTLFAQCARKLLPLLQYRLALAAELRLRIRVLRLQRLVLLAKERHAGARRVTVLDRLLKLLQLRLPRLCGLLE